MSCMTENIGNFIKLNDIEKTKNKAIPTSQPLYSITNLQSAFDVRSITA